ncbi:uncharacterized protein LAESUDRAFT_757902 [Laetiporus sulphureus 93-53]|uniref:Uncharacterized protein n=1 Tax=Laetiporus sulphureus 93-53 TaxID=1314785 RepID=A0A165F298_9APHY|nr:uncharacterized protein LAESUDRAFT_757902 [Laetiporus sulphureus 93-53]KZT08222.1 hypothetical protein LAESUDRAFT_757902 [Laetiporus sulphureus 93-53]
MSPPATEEEIRDIARRAVKIFADNGYNCCLFGSIGCSLYGISRCPNDVDLIVLTDEDAEGLKRLLIKKDSRFYLIPARKRDADYKVLWYALSSSRSRRCKVDILTPGTLDLPNVPSQHIKRKQRLPVMPILPLLLTKLRGWTDHWKSLRGDKWRKLRNDVKDINELLSIACRTGTYINSNSLRWLREDFQDLVDDSQKRIYKYVKRYRGSADYWERLGFDAYK